MTEDIAALERDADDVLRRAMPQAYMQMLTERQRHAGEDGYAAPPEPAPLPAPLKIEIDYLDGRAALGTTSDVVNASLLRRTLAACVKYDVPVPEGAVAEIIEQLRLIGPQDPFEASFAGLYIAAQMSALDCFRLARNAGFITPLGQTMLAFADKLAVRCIETSGAFQRRRDAKRKVRK
jgi:hypothetical protein